MTIFLPNMAQPPAALGRRVYWNPFDLATETLSNGDLTMTWPGGGTNCGGRATKSHTTTGKYYFEVHGDVVNGGNQQPSIGVATATWTLGAIGGSGFWALDQNGFTHGNGSSLSSGVTLATNDVIGVAVDLAVGNIWFAQNNVWILSGNPSTGINPTWATVSGAVFPASTAFGSASGTATQVSGRFLSSAWSYTPPTGFGAW